MTWQRGVKANLDTWRCESTNLVPQSLHLSSTHLAHNHVTMATARIQPIRSFVCVYVLSWLIPLPASGCESRNKLLIITMAVLLSYITVAFVEKLHPDMALSEARAVACLLRHALKLEVCSVRLLWSTQITAVQSGSPSIHAVSLSLYMCLISSPGITPVIITPIIEITSQLGMCFYMALS